MRLTATQSDGPGDIVVFLGFIDLFAKINGDDARPASKAKAKTMGVRSAIRVRENRIVMRLSYKFYEFGSDKCE
jgi:hypothetical protein